LIERIVFDVLVTWARILASRRRAINRGKRTSRDAHCPDCRSMLKVALIEAHPNHDKFRMLQMRKLREAHIQDPREFFTLSPVLQPIGHAIAIAR
jgi:hypothetical protein